MNVRNNYMIMSLIKLAVSEPWPGARHR